MRDLDYLQLLSKTFPTKEDALAEIINLTAIMELPKGTEYFLSDIHGEYESFSYLMRSSSSIILNKIHILFGNSLTNKEERELIHLVCYPHEALLQNDNYNDLKIQKITIERLVKLASMVSSKYTRSKVRKKMPKAYGYALDELMHTNEDDMNKALYHGAIIDAICKNGAAHSYIVALCELIQNLAIDHLHIVGDIYDRGPRADKIMDDLIAFHDVDIQWGNHDVSWIGACCGNLACICNVLRIATLYYSFDVLEDGYGINLRSLSMYAKEVYANDPCECFRPHLFDLNISDSVEPDLAAKMCKTVTLLLFKLEGQIAKRHPEYELNHRLLLDKIDFQKGTININGKHYELLDKNLPFINPKDPYSLTEKEIELLEGLRYSFVHSEKLISHIKFLLNKGSMYKTFNGNLLTHGCIPLDEKSNFLSLNTPQGQLSGKSLLDYFDKRVRDICRACKHKEENVDTDLFYYLWCGSKSPLFGKDKMATFERIFLSDKSLHEELYNPYYTYYDDVKVVERILVEFGLDPNSGHVINGHVPVITKRGETPIKAKGKLLVIDGGLAKAYQTKTGIAGYTLIFNSHHLAIVEHTKFEKFGNNSSRIFIVDTFKKRVMVKDTDIGKRLNREKEDLLQLVEAYSNGLIK